MKFEKRLIILGGENNAKGTVTLERNAYGTFATVCTYNMTDLVSGEYAIGIKNSEEVFTRKIGLSGKITLRFKISDMSLSGVHCIVYVSATQEPVLYGHTPDTIALWAGNMMDGIRSRKVEFPQTVDKKEIEKALPNYSDRPQEIGDYFLDILPAGAAYSDNALAQVNYYPSDMSIEVSYTKRGDTGFIPPENPIDRHVHESVSADGSGQEDGDVYGEAKKYIDSLEATPATEVAKNVQSEGITEKKSGNESEAAATVASVSDATSPIPPLSGAIESSAEKEEPREEKANVEVPPASSYTVENALKDKKTEAVFYEQIKTQLDSLFASNPPFETLEKAMPETKWVKVDYDGSGKYYVVGIIGAKPDYICYGVPAKFSPVPPDELDGYCQWLPLKEDEPEGDGFWIMYQDAISGESVKK